MSSLIVDGKKFIPYTTDNEAKFEEYVKQYYKEIFGEKSLLFEKKKLTSLAGIGSIPDGFVIDFSSRKWFIVEVEIKKHDPHTHIAQQISKFMTTIYQPNKDNIIDSFYHFITDDPYRTLVVKDWIGSGEVYKFLKEVVEREPSIIVFIDEKTQEVVEACNTFKFPTNVQEFKIFQREDVGISVYAVQFEPISPISKTPTVKTVLEKLEGTEPKRSSKAEEEKSQHPNLMTVDVFFIYRGKKYLGKYIVDSKKIIYEGKPYSPSAASGEITKTSRNGWRDWKFLDEQGREQFIDELR